MESVIEVSLERTQTEQDALARQSDPVRAAAEVARTSPDTIADLDLAKLKLEMNDVASGIAAGTGFGGMHAILLFGSLLASEGADFGVLYQPSCTLLPSLIVNALNSFFFFFLDIFWMQFTFYGMRWRLIFPRGGGELVDMIGSKKFGAYFGNTRSGGNAALLIVLVSHFLAAGFTTFNAFDDGCVLSLSLVPAVLLVVAFLYWSGISKIFTPLPNSNVRLSLPAAFSYGGRAEALINGETPPDVGEDDPVLQARRNA